MRRPTAAIGWLKGRQEAIWPTAQVLFVRTVIGHSPLANLLRIRVDAPARPRTMPKNCENQELHDIDLKLVGWPWAENNFSWTEPTVVGLSGVAHARLSANIPASEGTKMLLDRAMDEGGINYGNRQILGRFTEPIPGRRALMLLALQGGPSAPRSRRPLFDQTNSTAGISNISAGPSRPGPAPHAAGRRRSPGSTR